MSRETKVPYDLHFLALSQTNKQPFLFGLMPLSICPELLGHPQVFDPYWNYLFQAFLSHMPQKFAEVFWSTFSVYSPIHEEMCTGKEFWIWQVQWILLSAALAPLMEQINHVQKITISRGMIGKGNWETAMYI